MNRINNFKDYGYYKGWQLVNTGGNYYSACKGNVRAAIGSMHRGDITDLVRRFRKKVDQMEERNVSTDD